MQQTQPWRRTTAAFWGELETPSGEPTIRLLWGAPAIRFDGEMNRRLLGGKAIGFKLANKFLIPSLTIVSSVAAKRTKSGAHLTPQLWEDTRTRSATGTVILRSIALLEEAGETPPSDHQITSRSLGEDSMRSAPILGTIPGGDENQVNGTWGFAAGRKAFASHQGTFVWADSTDAPFRSTGDNQFLVRASGGIGFNTTSPGSGVHIKQKREGGSISTADGLRLERAASASYWTISNWSDDDLVFGHSTGIFAFIDDEQGMFTPSDRRLKQDIEPLHGALGTVAKLKPCSYRYKQAVDRDQYKSIGFIAQDVEKILPNLVEEKGEHKAVAYNGFIPPQHPGYPGAQREESVAGIRDRRFERPPKTTSLRTGEAAEYD